MKRFAKLLGLSVVVLAVPLAYAGSKSSFQVWVDPVGRSAYGSFGSARNSADAVQNIYCRTNASSTGTESVRCYATNSAGTTVTCFSTSATLVRSAQALVADSYVALTWDASGLCTSIDVLKGSHLAPKDP